MSKKRNQKFLEFDEFWLSHLGLFPDRHVKAGRLKVILALVIFMFLAMVSFLLIMPDLWPEFGEQFLKTIKF